MAAEMAKRDDRKMKPIPNITPWINKKYDEDNFQLMQAMTNHGCFAGYIHRFNLLDSPSCWFFDAECYNASHTLFEFCRWMEEWKTADMTIKLELKTYNKVDAMLKFWRNLDAITEWITKTIKTKEDKRRSRRRQTQLSQDCRLYVEDKNKEGRFLINL